MRCIRSHYSINRPKNDGEENSDPKKRPDNSGTGSEPQKKQVRILSTPISNLLIPCLERREANSHQKTDGNKKATEDEDQSLNIGALNIGAPQKGSLSGKGNMAPDEAMSYDGISWHVQDFIRKQWAVETTRCYFQFKRKLCALRALTGSMRNQYPNSEYVEGFSNEQIINRLLGILLEVRKELPAGPDDTPDYQVDEILQRWTRGNFSLVVCDNSDEQNCHASSLAFNEDSK